MTRRSREYDGLTPEERREIKKEIKTAARGMRNHNTRVTTSSAYHGWRTPALILALVRRFGMIGLDPSASTRTQYQFAQHNYTGEAGNDGLRRRWRRRGLVYCNPPYGRQLVEWVRKACRVFGRVDEGSQDELIMLIPARPDTRWFHDLILRHAHAVCFWKGRIKFEYKDHTNAAPFPSMLVYFGRRPHKFEKVFRDLGWVATAPRTKTKQRSRP